MVLKSLCPTQTECTPKCLCNRTQIYSVYYLKVLGDVSIRPAEKSLYFVHFVMCTYQVLLTDVR